MLTMFALALSASALWLRERHSVAHAAYGLTSSIELHDLVGHARKALSPSVVTREP
jgi:hypothetical protein